MVKKQRTVNINEATKIKQGKNNKTKNKQMFTELKTHEENKISRFSGLKSSHMSNPQQMIDEGEQNSFLGNVEQLNLKKDEDVEQIRAMVHQLMNKNKISAKNAFEIPMIDIQKLEEFNNISQSEHGWSKMSSTLQVDSKIYSYRVDAIHSIAFKIINTMTRNRDDALQKQEQEPKKQNENEEGAQPQKRVVPLTLTLWDDIDLSAQLQKNIDNINIQSIDKLSSQFNPTFQRTRRRFDQNGLRGMLLNNIQLDPNLELSLNLTRKIRPTGFYQQAMPVKVDELKEQLQICRSIQNTKKSIFNITKQEFVPSTGYEISWRRVRQGQLSFERISADINQNEMDIENQEQRNENLQYRKVEDAIKLKAKKRPSLRSSSDIAQDGIGWLSEMDKKMLGISTKNQNINQNTLIKKASSIKIQKEINQDDIEFNMMKVLQKKQVFTEETTERHKQQFNQQIEQKHLLPLRLFHKFKVQQIMTLRQELPQILHQPDPQNYQQEINQNQRQREQIDLKRQQISIRQSKQRLKGILKKQMKFSTLCNKFEIVERNVTPQLCFLTILHLANQNNLRLEQCTDFDFIIKS